MKKFIVIVTLLVAFGAITGVAGAQELPGDNPTLDARFRTHIKQIVGLNPQIEDFHRMQPGTAYKLAAGSSDALSPGDTKGIWGREFKKWYGYEYTPANLENPPTVGQLATAPAAAPLTKADIEALLDQKLAGITTDTGIPWWMWLLLALALIAAAILAGRLYENGRFDDALAASRQREDESRRRESEAYRREHEARKETLQAKDETIQALKDQSSTLEDSLEAANGRYTELLGIFTDTRKMEHHRKFDGPVVIPGLEAFFGDSAGGHLSIVMGDHSTLNFGDGQTVNVTTEQNVETKEPAYT